MTHGNAETECPLLSTGAVELYFYGELELDERLSVESHLAACAECRQAHDELSTIREALAGRPVVHAPADGDWRGFMARLDETVRFEEQARESARVLPMPTSKTARRLESYAPYLAVAALVTLVASGVVFVARHAVPVPPTITPVVDRTPASSPPPAERTADAVFATLSEQHFERSKLVVLGLANKDPRVVDDADWAYERGMASSLLSDTRLYRIAAEERGMKTIAGVMGDLELVLLQTSLADTPDPAALAQIQRLIHKRDLVTKMDISTTGS